MDFMVRFVLRKAVPPYQSNPCSYRDALDVYKRYLAWRSFTGETDRLVPASVSGILWRLAICGVGHKNALPGHANITTVTQQLHGLRHETELCNLLHACQELLVQLHRI
jgi:hypothetical protein